MMMRFSYGADRMSSGGFSAFFILPGGLLILLGLLIVLFPALLRVMVASFFILMGFLVLGFGLTMRKTERGMQGRNDIFVDR